MSSNTSIDDVVSITIIPLAETMITVLAVVESMAMAAVAVKVTVDNIESYRRRYNQ